MNCIVLAFIYLMTRASLPVKHDVDCGNENFPNAVQGKEIPKKIEIHALTNKYKDQLSFL